MSQKRLLETGEIPRPYKWPDYCTDTKTVNEAKSETHQEFKDACDINKILKKYAGGAIGVHVARDPGAYRDLCPFESYQEMLNTVVEAQQSFEALPSEIRKRFANDPKYFLEFAQNPDNQDEMLKLGLIKRPVLEKPKPGEGETGERSAGPSKKAQAPQKAEDRPPVVGPEASLEAP